jgi:hypothetical protein
MRADAASRRTAAAPEISPRRAAIDNEGIPMQQPNLRAPLAVLVIGVIGMALLLSRAPGGEVAFSQSYSSPATSTPVPTATSAPTSTAQPTTTSGSQAQPVATSTVAPTATANTLPTAPATVVAQPTARPAPTAAPTPIPAGELVCAPGAPVIIQGAARPRAPLLLFFNGRAIGGGSASATGSFALTMRVGNERPGSYPIQVFVRGSWEEVLQTTCTVPSVTQSPLING